MGQAPGVVPMYPQPYMAAHYAAPPMKPFQQPYIGGAAFGGGGIMQMARNAFQQIRQFPQQLHQLAHQFSHYPSHTMQQALNAARPFSHRPHAGMRPPVFVPPPPQMPAMGIPVGIPMGRVQTPAVPAQRVEAPMVLIPRPQIQTNAQKFGAQVHSFDAVALNKLITQLGAEMTQRVNDLVGILRQSFQAPVALAQNAGGGAAAAAAPPDGGAGKLKQD